MRKYKVFILPVSGNTNKRKSEEPLFPLFKKLVDETIVDDVIDEKSEKSKESVSEGDSEDSTEEEEKWEVEEIVDYQYCRQSEAGLYLVKWIGWESEHNTWLVFIIP